MLFQCKIEFAMSEEENVSRNDACACGGVNNWESGWGFLQPHLNWLVAVTLINVEMYFLTHTHTHTL